MYRKLISAIFAGAYIGIGATTYFLVEDKFFASIMFTVGIFLVMNFFDILFTKVVPFNALGYYKPIDALIAIVGNTIGGIIYAFLISVSRLGDKIAPKIKDVVDIKLNDGVASVLIMSILCAVVVAYAVIVNKRYEKQPGLGIFFYLLFISAFVICGFDHIVANVFYYTVYSFKFGFDSNIIFNFIIVLFGNIIGGLFIGFSEKYRMASVTISNNKKTN